MQRRDLRSIGGKPGADLLGGECAGIPQAEDARDAASADVERVELVRLVVGRRLDLVDGRLNGGRGGLARGFRLAHRVEGGVTRRANVALGNLARFEVLLAQA